MSIVASILHPDCVVARVDSSSRKAALDLLSDALAVRIGTIDQRALFDALLARERLGSTGLGDGVAIPHCRTECDEIYGALITLKQGIDFDADDGSAVDMLFALVVPNNEASAHLNVLAELAAIFQDPENREALRSEGDNEQLFERFMSMTGSDDPDALDATHNR